MTASCQVRLAGEEDVRAASLALSRAFRDDPVHRWVLPEELDWALFSAAFFASVMRESRFADAAFTTAGHEGAALWTVPYPKPVPWRIRVFTVLGWYLALGRRARRVGAELARLEAAHPPEPHWYLPVLGVDPRHQGKGLGSALLRPVLARCDADRFPAYLESSKEENVPFYERHGFVVQGELRLRGGPTVWRMRREARR